MDASLVQGRHLIRGIAADGTPEIVNDAALLQRAGRIEAIGPFDELRAAHPDLPLLGSPRHLVCPGFVNAHHHVGLTPLQHGAPDLPLEFWIVRRIAGRAVDLYLDTLYSAFELLASGVTTVQHLHARVPKPIDNILHGANEVIRAYRDIGMRVSYSFGLRDQNRLVYEDDASFLHRLPPDLHRLAAAMLDEQTLTIEQSLEVFTALHAQHADAGRTRIQLAPVNLHWCSDAAIAATVETARRHRVPLHMHLLETPLQREYARRRTGGSAVAHLRRLGALGPDMTLGHGTWLTEADIATLAETGTCLCHNASSNLRLRSGLAPINACRKHGVRLALGIDEAGLNEDRDMLQEMRLVLNLHRTPGLDPAEVPSAADVFRMATEGGAATTPYGTSIGRLDPGRAADLLLFDADAIGFPGISPDVPVLDALLRRGRPAHLHAVIVGGEVVLKEGAFTRVDRDAALAEFAAKLRAPLTATEQRNRRLGLELMEYAKQVYADYPSTPQGTPYAVSNSRT